MDRRTYKTDGAQGWPAGSGMERRAFPRIGTLGAAGLSLGRLLRCEALAKAPSVIRDRPASVIILWMRGGPSHIDMWDPKPDAPVQYRGEFGTIPTKVPGIRLSDLLPMCSGRPVPVLPSGQPILELS